MGRNAKFDRSAALEQCMNEIWRHGYEACSVKAISEKLGITRSSFYNAFGSREALLLETLDLYAKQTPDQILNDADHDTPIKPLLTVFFKNVCQLRAGDPEHKGCLLVNCLNELVGVDAVLGKTLKQTIQLSIEQFEKLITIAIERGELNIQQNPYEIAISLQNLLIGLSVMSKVISDEKKLFSIAQKTLQGLGLYKA